MGIEGLDDFFHQNFAKMAVRRRNPFAVSNTCLFEAEHVSDSKSHDVCFQNL